MYEVKDRVRDIVKDHPYIPDNITDDSPLWVYLDSIDMMDLVVDLEEAFSIDLDDKKFSAENLPTINKIAELVEQQL